MAPTPTRAFEHAAFSTASDSPMSSCLPSFAFLSMAFTASFPAVALLLASAFFFCLFVERFNFFFFGTLAALDLDFLSFWKLCENSFTFNLSFLALALAFPSFSTFLLFFFVLLFIFALTANSFKLNFIPMLPPSSFPFFVVPYFLTSFLFSGGRRLFLGGG